jgi:hypothetical protein
MAKGASDVDRSGFAGKLAGRFTPLDTLRVTNGYGVGPVCLGD